MENKTFDIIVAGHICLDIIPEFDDMGITEIRRILTPGKLVNVGTATLSTGGPVSNTGIALQKLNHKVAFIARVGDDEIGTLIRERLKKYGGITGIVVSKDEPTSYTVVIAIPGVDRVFLHNPGTNDTFSANDINSDLIEKAKLFHLGYPPLMKTMYNNNGEDLVEIYKRVKQADVTTSVDMSLPDIDSPSGKINWKNILQNLLPYVDICLPSIEEMFSMLEKEQYLELKNTYPHEDIVSFISPEVYSRLGKKMLELGTKIAVLKTAHRGYYIRTANQQELKTMGILPPKDISNWANRELWCPAFNVEKIAGATGSGDSSIAGFFSAYIRGYSIEKTLKLANCLGYQNLHALDALSGIKTWKESINMLENCNLETIDPQIEFPGWNYDPKLQLWTGPDDNIADRH